MNIETTKFLDIADILNILSSIFCDTVKHLKDIATIRAGVPFRKKTETATSGGYLLVQMKDLGVGGLRLDELLRVQAPEAHEEHVLRKGDVLFSSRGKRNTAAAFLADVSDVIAGSQFFIIRPRSVVLPEYLAWFLNQKTAQDYIAANRAGSFVAFLPKESLGNLLIPIPPLEVQRKIAAVYQLILKEQELLENIKTKRRLFVEGALQKAAQQSAK